MKKGFLWLRVIHGICSLYFVGCLAYLYYSVVYFKPNLLLAIAIISLGIEGFLVFILNKGNCPLIHIQRKIGDDKPFFELFLPHNLAKRAMPMFAVLTWIAVILLVLRYLVSGS